MVESTEQQQHEDMTMFRSSAMSATFLVRGEEGQSMAAKMAPPPPPDSHSAMHRGSSDEATVGENHSGKMHMTPPPAVVDAKMVRFDEARQNPTKHVSRGSTAALRWNLIRSKLYDRKHQSDTLLHAWNKHVCKEKDTATESEKSNSKTECTPAVNYDDCCSDLLQHPELVLVTGPSGTGKTHLVETVLLPHSNYFLKGKFELLPRPEPFYAFVHAFTKFTHDVCARGPNEAQQMKRKILENVESTALLLDVIPALEQILGKEEGRLENDEAADLSAKLAAGTHENGTAKLKGMHALHHFVYIFSKFVAAISSPENPIILFLDDLQWADPASLQLLSALVTSCQRGFFIVGACRGNQVSKDHVLSVTLRDLEANRVIIKPVVIENWNRVEPIQNLVSDLLTLPSEATLPLAKLLFQFTGGNSFFVLRLLQTLIEDSMIYYHRGDGKSGWRWQSEDSILSNINFDNALLMVKEIVDRLPKESREVMIIAACLGAEFDEFTLRECVDFDICAALADAKRKGLIDADEFESTSWRFVHDTIQQGAYMLINEEDQPTFHLQIGRRLWDSFSSNDVALNIFLVVNQLQLGADLIKDEEERARMAILCLHAGEKSTESSAFQAAANYLSLGISMLERRHWRDQYQLSLNLYNAAAEVECCNSNMKETDRLVGQVLENARCDEDKLRAQTTQVYSLGARNELTQAVNSGLQVLGGLGFKFPKKPSVLQMIAEMYMTKRIVKKRTNQEILDLPRLTDSTRLAALRILNLLFHYAMNTDPLLGFIVVFRNVRETFKHGISRMSAVGFVGLSMAMCAFGDTSLGCRMSELAVDTIDAFQANEWAARIYTGAFGFCFPTARPLRDQIQPILAGYRAGIGSGDIEFGCAATSLYVSLGIHCSLPLGQLFEDIKSFRRMVSMHQQSVIVLYLSPMAQLASNLISEEVNNKGLNGNFCNVQKIVADGAADGNTTILSLIPYFELLNYAAFQEIEKAYDVSLRLRTMVTDSFPVFYLPYMNLFQGMAVLSCPGKKKKFRMAGNCLTKLKSLASNSTENYGNKLNFLQAEIYRAKRKNPEIVIQEYQQAIDKAREQKFHFDEGLAHERLSGFYADVDDRINARSHVESAISVYKQWGARAKVVQLEKLKESPSGVGVEANPGTS